jgi:hypothetical protein
MHMLGVANTKLIEINERLRDTIGRLKAETE